MGPVIYEEVGVFFTVGHGYLKIPLKALCDMGVAHLVTPYSLIGMVENDPLNQLGFAYLEIDCDAQMAHEALEYLNLPWNEPSIDLEAELGERYPNTSIWKKGMTHYSMRLVELQGYRNKTIDLGLLEHLKQKFRHLEDGAGTEPVAEKQSSRSALDALTRILDPDHPDTIATIAVLTQLYWDERKPNGPEEEVLWKIVTYEATRGPEHFDTLEGAANLAGLLMRSGDFGASKLLYGRTLERLKQFLGPEHPETLICQNNIAVLLHDQKEYAAAEQIYRHVLEVRERTLGSHHPHTLYSMTVLGLLHDAKGDYDEAESWLQKSLDLHDFTLGPDHRDTLRVVGYLALVLWSKGDCTDAERLQRREFESFERMLGADHPDVLESSKQLETMQKTMTNIERIKGRESCEHCLGNGFVSRADIVRLGRQPHLRQGVCQQCSELSQRESKIRFAMVARETLYGPDHPDTVASMLELGIFLHAKRAFDEAESLLRRALETRERVVGQIHPDTIACFEPLALLLRAKGDLAGAEAMHRRALAVREQVLGPEHPDSVSTLRDLASLLEMMGDLAAAEVFHRQALGALENIAGPDHVATRQQAESLRNSIAMARTVERISGRFECEQCLGTGFISYEDIQRFDRESKRTPGVCDSCNEAVLPTPSLTVASPEEDTDAAMDAMAGDIADLIARVLSEAGLSHTPENFKIAFEALVASGRTGSD